MRPLYDCQLDSIHEMKNGCILCGGVGSGKSITALGYFYLRFGGSEEFLRGGNYSRMKNPKNLYIITTARKRDTKEWEAEMSPFLFSMYKMTVTVDSWNKIKKYTDVSGSFFIFDEQRAVGKGAWSKGFIKIAKSNEWIMLSATPGDTWMDYVPVFIANGFYRNRTEFSREHVVYDRYSRIPGQIDHYVNIGRLIRLRNSLLVDIDMHRKAVRHHIDILVEYDAKAYKELGKTRWNTSKNEPIANASELCYQWRKIVNSDQSRIEAALDIFYKHKKVIIFYNFDYELELLRTAFVFTTIGEWNGHKHQDLPQGDNWVYLVQYTAGAEGWNCIKTDTIIFYSQSYSYKAMDQAAGRIDRLNTPYDDLYFYHLKSKAKIDLAIDKALKEKKNFNEGKFVKW